MGSLDLCSFHDLCPCEIAFYVCLSTTMYVALTWNAAGCPRPRTTAFVECFCREYQISFAQLKCMIANSLGTRSRHPVDLLAHAAILCDNLQVVKDYVPSLNDIPDNHIFPFVSLPASNTTVRPTQLKVQALGPCGEMTSDESRTGALLTGMVPVGSSRRLNRSLASAIGQRMPLTSL